MPFEKHELNQKQKNDWLKCWKEYIDHYFNQTVFIDETLFRVEQTSKEMEQYRGKHGISYNKHGKNANAWAGICKGGKTSIEFLLRIWLKNYMLA